jgi:putative aldouronate transport system permease protein
MTSLAAKPGTAARKRRKLTRERLLTYLTYHAMMLPAVVLLVIFSYIPMAGILMAFEDFNPLKGLFGSTWVGFANYRHLFVFNNLGHVLFNTVFIASMKIVAGLIVPIVFALLLNEIASKAFVRSIQTMVYLPYFLSWVVMAGILINVLSPSDGIVNAIIKSFGLKSVYFLGDKKLFPYVMVAADVWKNFGFGTIIYLAALTGIDPSLYEAAKVDGANRWQQTRHITLPGMSTIIVLTTVLAIGGILEAGFDEIFNLYNPLVYDTGDIIDTLVYRMGMLDMNYSLSTAVGLMKSLVAMFLIILSYKLADKYAGYKIF